MSLREFLQDTWKYVTRQLAPKSICKPGSRGLPLPAGTLQDARPHSSRTLGRRPQLPPELDHQRRPRIAPFKVPARQLPPDFCNLEYIKAVAHWITEGLMSASGLPDPFLSRI